MLDDRYLCRNLAVLPGWISCRREYTLRLALCKQPYHRGAPAPAAQGDWMLHFLLVGWGFSMPSSAQTKVNLELNDS
jgi:hypothetical protein